MNNPSVANRGAATNTNGARTSNGASPASIEVEVIDFKHHDKNTLRGFADILLPTIGLKILGCTFHEKDDSRWRRFPGRPFQEGRQTKWALILDIPDKDQRIAFQKAAVAAVDAYLGEVNPLHGSSF